MQLQLEKTSLARPVAGVLTVLATVVLTALSYRFLEKPFLRARSDVLKPKQVEPAPVERDEQAA